MDAPPPDPPDRLPAQRFVRATGEAVLVALALVSAWPFASAEPPFEFALSAGCLLLTALWAAHAALVGRFTVRPDVVSFGLLGIAAWGAAQLVPLPESVVGIVSPARLEWHRTLLPEQGEVLPGESDAVPRPTMLPLTADPYATRAFVARVLGVLLVYAAARNWLATRESFPRLAWAAVANGVLLAAFALGHAASAPRNVVYWTMPVEGTGTFGPFVNRNHYADYAALCAGLGLGLLLPRSGRGQTGPPTARSFGLAAAVGLILASIPFSLSRGSGLSVVAAGVGTWLLARAAGRPRGTGTLVMGLAAVVVVVAAWFGTGAVADRFATLGDGASESRLPLWRDSAKLLPSFWATGTGGGTFQWVEPTVRDAGNPTILYDRAHNEYLEALVEGGLVRFALTLVVVVGVLVVVGRGYLQRRDRSVGPWLLGAWFGLAVGAVHAVTDFGIQMPAVAVLTAVVVGYAVAAATEPGFVPQRVRVRRNGEPVSREAQPRAETPRSWPWWVALVPVVAATFVALDARDRYLADRLRLAALFTLWKGSDPDHLAERARLLERRAEVRPDTAALFDAALARLDLAVQEAWEPAAAVAGGAGGFAAPVEQIPPSVAQRHVVPALKLLRAARAANPLAPKPHTRLGLYAGHFTRSEPAGVHFARAKRLLPGDPDVWFASGKEALRRNDTAVAWADWKHSLALSPRHLRAVLTAAREKLSPTELRAKLLPDDPVTLLAAADFLFPDREAQAADRRPFTEAAAAHAGRGKRTPEQFMAVAAALDELGRPEEATEAWKQAVALAPERTDVRDRFARWLEQEELYDDAIPHLEWLRGRRPGDGTVQDRLDAARHGLKLQRAIRE